MSVPVTTIVTHVLVNGLAVCAPGEPITPANAITVLDAINGVLDDWNAETQANYAEVFLTGVATGANPEVIGPGGTGAWLMAARPVTVDGVAVDGTRIFTTTDPRWWDAQDPMVGGLAGAYYSADEPDGSLYFSAPPGAGTALRLMLRTTLGPVLLTDVLTLPQGYQSALELTVMEAVVDAFHATLTQSQITRAGKARARIFSNNLRIPALTTAGLGLPGTGPSAWPLSTTRTGGSWMQGGWTQ